MFIHGLGGDPFTTWRYGSKAPTSWPYWLGEEFPDVGIWSLGYASSPTKWARIIGFLLRRRDAGYSMSLPDRATQALDLMAQIGLGRRPMIFVCHSLGGLLAKQILRKSDDTSDARQKQIAARTKAILFLATPHAGASLASLMVAFRTVFGATVSIEDLRAHDAHLRDLYEWYRQRSVTLGIETVTYYELRPARGVLTIVTPTSSHPGVGAAPVGLDEDHLSIAKPRDRQAQVCGAARKLLADLLSADQHAQGGDAAAASPGSGAVPIPAGNIFVNQGTIVINSGTSNDTSFGRKGAEQIQRTSPNDPIAVDEELMWRLLDEIKSARRTFERQKEATLLRELRTYIERSGNAWSRLLRTEALLLLAEEESARILQSRTEGKQVDCTALQQLLKEIRDAGN